MTRELIDLRTSILEERYADALLIVDELEAMSKQAILRNIESFLLGLLIHLIKNQVEQRLTNSWAASITGSIRSIQKLNIKDNKTSYYIKPDEWEQMLLEELEAAISVYLNARTDRSVLDTAYEQLNSDREAGRDTSFGLYMIGDGEKFVDDYRVTFANKGFLISRIYNPIARPMFQDQLFRDYLIEIGLLDYWKNHGFPYFCRENGENDFQCDP